MSLKYFIYLHILHRDKVNGPRKTELKTGPTKETMTKIIQLNSFIQIKSF